MGWNDACELPAVMEAKGSNPYADLAFSATPKDDEVIGESEPQSFVSVRNLTAAGSLAPEQGFYETNTFTKDGTYRLKVPEGEHGDYVQVLQSVPGKLVRHQIVQLHTDDAARPRKQFANLSAFELVPAEEGSLRLTPKQESRILAPIGTRVWFLNASTKEVRSLVVQQDGTPPDSFRLKGSGRDQFLVTCTECAHPKTPSFWGAGRVGAARRTPGEFDSKKMVAHRGPLYVDGVSGDDPIQGDLGDCWLVDAVSAIAHARPEFIESLFEDLGDDLYRVSLNRFDHETETYVPDQVEVSARFYRGLRNPRYGRARGSTSKKKMELWFALLEKAFAQLSGSYASLNGGGGTTVLAQLLGHPAVWLDHADRIGSEFLFASIQDAMDDRQPVTAASRADFSWKRMLSAKHGRGIVRNHGYTVIGVSERNGQRFIKLRNPWGRYGPTWSGFRTGMFELPFETFLEAFGGTVIGRFPKTD